MDAKLRRELTAIARDNRSGATELAIRATDAICLWLKRHKALRDADLMRAAHAVLEAQPAMAPFRRLANELALCAERSDSVLSLTRSLNRFHKTLRNAPQKISTAFVKALARGKERVHVTTYSYSSTVIRALVAARRHISYVSSSEARPACEGFKAAEQLAKSGLAVWLRTDAELFSNVLSWQTVVVGADAVLTDCFLNKVGTQILVNQAQKMGARVWILSDTTKFWPQSWCDLWKPEGFPPGGFYNLWPDAPNGVDARYASSAMYGNTPFMPDIRFLTEKGWMTPARVRRELRKIRISPRLKTLVD